MNPLVQTLTMASHFSLLGQRHLFVVTIAENHAHFVLSPVNVRYAAGIFANNAYHTTCAWKEIGKK